MAADGESNLAVIHNNLIKYEENAQSADEVLEQERRVFADLQASHDRLQGRVEQWEEFQKKEKKCEFLNLKLLNVSKEHMDLVFEKSKYEYETLKAQADKAKEELMGKTLTKIKILGDDLAKCENEFKQMTDMDHPKNKGKFSREK